jgi:predicted DNA-binding protein with PD1-like motif
VTDAQIRHLDPAKRIVVLALDDGREITTRLAPNANIEVVEPATLGTMGGTFEDLRIGYWVRAQIHEPGTAMCACTSLVCVS